MLFVSTIFSGYKVFAGEQLVDNDAAAGQPGLSHIMSGNWTWISSGYFGDARISYDKSGAFYAYGFNPTNRTNVGNFYAYLANPAFESTAAYNVASPPGIGEGNTIEQYYAAVGWNWIGDLGATNWNLDANVGKPNNVNIQGGLGADAFKVTW